MPGPPKSRHGGSLHSSTGIPRSPRRNPGALGHLPWLPTPERMAPLSQTSPPNSRFILHKVPAHTTCTMAQPVHSSHAGDTTATTYQAPADARNHASKVTRFSSKSPASWDTCHSQANQNGWAPNTPGPGLIAVTQACSPT